MRFKIVNQLCGWNLDTSSPHSVFAAVGVATWFHWPRRIQPCVVRLDFAGSNPVKNGFAGFMFLISLLRGDLIGVSGKIYYPVFPLGPGRTPVGVAADSGGHFHGD